MEIDWVTVAAQIVNFLVLVYLLKRLLYQPVINAMARREQRIADRLNEAEQQREAAETEAAEYRERSRSLEQERERRMREAEQAAEDKRQSLIDEARKEARQLSRQWREEIERERGEFLNALRQRAARTITHLSRRALQDLANRDLEQQIILAFLDRLDTLEDATRQALHEHTGEPATVTTTFEPSEELREQLRSKIRQRVPGAEAVEFERSSELICGIRLQVGGYTIAWTVADYVQSVEDEVDEQLITASQTAE